jgi:hypothetical protein
MTTKAPSQKPGLGAALAATIASERQSSDDRFAKAERLHRLAAGNPDVAQEETPPPAPANPRPTRAPQDTRRSGGGESRPPTPPVVHEKVIRDTFTFPPSDHKRIKAVIQEGLQAAIQVNKSEVIRAGLIALQELSAEKRRALLASVEKMKPGRPAE